MAQFATADEFADRLGATFSAAQETRADNLLERASGVVQDAAKQMIELVEDDEFTFYGLRETTMLLPERPVVSVASVTIADDDDPLNVSAYALDGDELLYSSSWPLDLPVTVVYTHGYDPIPDAVKEIVLAAVTRVWVNPGSAVAERLAQAQLTWAVEGIPTGMLLTADEQRALRRALGSGSRSLPIR